MRRYEVYINNSGGVSLSGFKTLNSEYEEFVISGSQAYQYISKLATSKILRIRDSKNSDDLILDCSDCVIRLNECTDLIKKRGAAPLIDSARRYFEEQKLKETKSKKAKRKNKYTGKRIIAGGIAGIVLLSCSIGISKKNNNTKDENSYPGTNIEKQVEPEDKNVSLEFVTKANEEQNVPLESESKESNISSRHEEVATENSLDVGEDDDLEQPDISIDFEDRSDTKKARTTKAYYSDLIEKYANRYGLDPVIVRAIATQERGIHSSIMDAGGATGLMQIQNSVWENNSISAYNFETNKIETMNITPSMIKDVYKNVEIGCMYFQNCMNYMNNNIIAAVQCYNMGYGNMKTILTAYSNDVNRPIEDILNDSNDIGWLDYREIVDVGDPNYVENVFSWIGPDFKIRVLNSNNTATTLSVNNNDSKKIY